MKNIKYYIKKLKKSWQFFPTRATYKFLLATLAVSFYSVLQAQDNQYSYSQPVIWFGAASAANFNFFQGSTQQLNAGFSSPVAFHKGNGVGLYLAPLVEIYLPGTRLGVMLQAGYDSRNGSFDSETTPCNCPADLETNLGYITIEPSVRFSPFRSAFYLFGGPRIAFNLDKSFTYKQGKNPAFPEQAPVPDQKGDLSNVYKTLLSMQVGAGFDIPLSSQENQIQTVLSPFVSFQPYFGQSPRSIETWTVTSLRAGASLKFGRGSKLPTIPASTEIKMQPQFRFTVNSPKNIPVERRVLETFPLRNYVFFDLGSTEIPDRYVLLKSNQVKDYKEDQLEVFAPKNLSGRSARGMVVYYNILNIIGDRMGKNPSTNITLAGSSEKGPEDGRVMAESIKRYLTDIFGINASRIRIEGRDKPKIASEKLGGTRDLELLREGDRRVSIESSSSSLLMEFQSGPNAPLKPVEFNVMQVAPLDSYVTFNVEGANEAFSSWSLEVKDEKGKIQYLGPYMQERVSIPGKTLLGTREKGDYKVTMIGHTINGNTVKREVPVHMVLWGPPEDEQGMRFSIIYEFDESKAINIYEKYLAEIVTPKIPDGALVIIHGYTDIIGDVSYNQRLSLARANDVKGIIEKSLLKAGKKDVKIDLYGFGEDEALSPFDNKYPEERFYNRTVIIDVIPK